MEIKDEYTYKELYNFWLGFTKEIESIFNSDLNEDIKKIYSIKRWNIFKM